MPHLTCYCASFMASQGHAAPGSSSSPRTPQGRGYSPGSPQGAARAGTQFGDVAIRQHPRAPVTLRRHQPCGGLSGRGAPRGTCATKVATAKKETRVLCEPWTMAACRVIDHPFVSGFGVLLLCVVQGVFTPWRADTAAAADDVSQLAEIQRPPRHRTLQQIGVAECAPAPTAHPYLSAYWLGRLAACTS